MEKELSRLNIQELNPCEQERVNGGSIVIACAVAGVFLASFSIGYAIGKDIWGGYWYE